MKVVRVELRTPMECPCCEQPVQAPSLDVIVFRYGIPPLQARILRAVCKGKGMPVQTERVFDAMYADDPNGGPSPTAMYRALKGGLYHLRRRLKGSGVQVENCGYRLGYRLALGQAALRVDASLREDARDIIEARRRASFAAKQRYRQRKAGNQQIEAING